MDIDSTVTSQGRAAPDPSPHPFMPGEETDSDDPMYDRRNTDSDENVTDWDSDGEGAMWRARNRDDEDEDLY
jgi:hypothetical protein